MYISCVPDTLEDNARCGYASICTYSEASRDVVSAGGSYLKEDLGPLFSKYLLTCDSKLEKSYVISL